MSDQPPKPRILAVDDSRVMRVAMKKILGADYDVVEAEHGEDAWTLLTNDNDIQVVFTDLSMPYLDGYGLLERMRAGSDVRLQDMPVIIITGKEDDDAAKQQALDKGADDFISKPFESIQLLARAKAHVKHKQTTTQLSETSHKLERQAAVDEVTGLGGQRYFCKASDDALAYMRRHGGEYVLLRMDIDDFNNLFIKYGKSAADGILRSVGQSLAKQVRQEDMLARVGLAKFAMFLRDISLRDAEQIAERVRSHIETLSFKLGDASIRITVSIGLLQPDPADQQDIKQQMHNTEVYLEQASAAGGNRVVAHSVAATTATPTLSPEQALQLTRKGETEAVKAQMDQLLLQMLPLLELAADQYGDDLGQVIARLKQQAKN